MGSGGDGSDGMGGGSDGGGGGVVGGSWASGSLQLSVSRRRLPSRVDSCCRSGRGVASVLRLPTWCTGSPAALRAFRPPCRRGPGHGSRLARLRTVCMKALKVVVETPHALRPWRGAGVLRTTAYTGGLTAGVGAWSCPLPSPAVRTAYVVRLVPARTRATVQRRPCERARVPVRLVNGITLAFRNVRPSI